MLSGLQGEGGVFLSVSIRKEERLHRGVLCDLGWRRTIVEENLGRMYS